MNLVYKLFFLIFLVVFNYFYFTTFSKFTVEIFCSYIFIHLSVIVIFIINRLTSTSKETAILNTIIKIISITYFVPEFIISWIFIFLVPEKQALGLIMQFIILIMFIATANYCIQKHKRIISEIEIESKNKEN